MPTEEGLFMKPIRSLLLATAIAALPTAMAIAQDPVKVAPQNYTVRVDNDKVRVLDIHVQAGAKVPMHAHPGHVIIADGPCKVRFTGPDAKSEVVDMKDGDVIWGNATSHSAENVGSSECHVYNLEVKGSK